MTIDHVAIAVRDIDTALPYYTQHLGLTVLHDERLPSAAVRLTYLDGGGTMLQLVQPLGPCPVADFLATQGEGLHHVCFAVEAIPATLATLGGEADRPIVLGGRSRRACFLAETPDGLRIELTETAPWAGDSGTEDAREVKA